MVNCFRKRNRCSCGCSPGEDCRDHTLPLCDYESGERVKVASIQGGRQLCARRAAMGSYPGVEMDLLCAGCGCPCMVRVHGGTLSLGAGVSKKIMVTSAV
jgi:ferrous iron transport protein A